MLTGLEGRVEGCCLDVTLFKGQVSRSLSRTQGPVPTVVLKARVYRQSYLLFQADSFNSEAR